MKTKILILLLLLTAASALKTNASTNDSVWTVSHWRGYKVSILGGDLHYSIKSIVKVEADDPNKIYRLKYDNGKVEPIKNNWFYITPNIIGPSFLHVDNALFIFHILPIPEPKLYLNGDKFQWENVISKEALMKTTGIEVKNKYTSFNVVSYTVTFNEKGDLVEVPSKDSLFSQDIIKHLQKVEVGQKFYIENIAVKNPDGSMRFVQAQTYRIVDDYNNEFIRKTVTFKPYTYDLNLMKNDLRIKITGHPSKKYIKIINDFADELNGLFETINVKIVDRQPSLTIKFDSIKDDSTYLKNGCKSIDGGYLVTEGSHLFFPFNKHFLMLIDTNRTSEDMGRCLRYDIVNLLGEFKENNIKGSIFNYSDSLSAYDKYMLKKMYAIGGEDEVQNILDDKFDAPDRNVVFFIMIILSVILLFVFSEIYYYYGFNYSIGKIKSKIAKRIIEAILVAQIPTIAVFILLIVKFIGGDFHEISLCLIFEIFFIPFAILCGILFLGVDNLLGKIKKNWIVIILNFLLSFFCIWLAYQIMYLFIAPEFVSPTNVGWKIMLIPFLITLYRIYARFQTNKISGLLQEKELELTKQKELKFKSDLNALQARINPHFLYNALNSLASLAYTDAGRTEKMALSLSKLFRYNINKEDDHFSSVKDEIEMASIYLDIEKNRFEDKLKYSIDVQNSIYDFRIPKFILQPLAENAVKHGISKITGKGIIKIKIFEEEAKVYIEIYDNGPEFPGGLISGYGLQNTYEKLKLLYKKPFEIEFINQPEKKLVIMLTK